MLKNKLIMNWMNEIKQLNGLGSEAISLFYIMGNMMSQISHI